MRRSAATALSCGKKSRERKNFSQAKFFAMIPVMGKKKRAWDQTYKNRKAPGESDHSPAKSKLKRRFLALVETGGNIGEFNGKELLKALEIVTSRTA